MNNGIYNTRFIHYNSSGEILTISPFKPEDEQLFLEIDFSFVEEFLFGNKSFKNYKINYFFNLINGIVNKEETVVSEDKKFLYIIPLTSSFNNEITIEYTPQYWRIVVREDIKEKIKLHSTLNIFVCKKDDPSFLYKELVFDLNSLSPVYFTNEVETNLKLITLVTTKQFSSYGIKESHE
jgi:hypothetical protein